MTKRFASLLLTAALGMAAAQASAQTGTPVDPALSNAAVTVEIGRYGGPLSSLLAALAKSAGYELILDVNVDGLPGAAATATTGAAATTGTATASTTPKPVVYTFDKKPFNEVWPLLMDVYGLTYEVVRLGTTPVLRVGNAPIQRVVALKYADPAEAANQVQLFFGTPTFNEVPQKDAQGNTIGTTRTLVGVKLDSATLRIVPDARSKSVIVRGTNKEVAEVERLLAQLDVPGAVTPPAATIPTIQRIYTVKSSAADIVAVLGAQYPALKATPVGQSGQLVISGPQDQLTAALELLAAVDRAPAAVVTTADVQPIQSVYNVKGGQDDAVAVIAAQYPGLKVTPVGKTGQLVINGPKNQVDAALALLATVDRALAQSPATIQRLFQLVNADAEEIKAVLLGQAATTTTQQVSSDTTTASRTPATRTNTTGGTTIQSQGQTVSTTVESAAQAGLLSESPPTIIADKRTNTLIVRGTPEQVEQIAQLIPQLDQKVPQINVQVRIQEITEKASRSLGVDWNLGFSGFRITAGTGGLSAAFDPTKTLQGFNIGPTLKTLEGQGLAKSVYDGTVTMQSGQRSLGSSTDTQNASSAAAATIKQGGRLEINIPSTSGNIQKQIDYGVNLDFYNPQVAPDGTITLRVRGQVNNLTTTIDADTIPNLLQFTNSEAQTTLTFKSGETLLLSGLLANKETSNNDGVPFLSSIPVVGGLFGTQKTSNDKAQLLVVITGTVVK